MEPWKLTDAEWEELGNLLMKAQSPVSSRGRPRLENDRHAAEACLFHHYRSLAASYRSFGWNQLPKEFGVSPSTANRRYREWSADGSWEDFWHALLLHRRPVLRRVGVPTPR